MSDFDALKGDSAWSAEYLSILADISETYKEDVMRRWEESHDRTGTTLETFAVETVVISPFETRPKITVGGNVGFVINPLPPHDIGVQGQTLWGPVHYTDRYSEFGPLVGPVRWYQGGEESHSPDLTWFQDAADALAGLGAAALFRVANKVREQVLGLIMVDGELVTGMTDVTWDIKAP